MTTTQATQQTATSTTSHDNATAAIAWFEIPVKDFQRARSFYERLLDVQLRDETMGAARMAVFPGPCEQTGGCLVAIADYEPSQNGSVVYLRTPGDLQTQLDLAPELGGAVLWPKTALPEGMGFFAQIRDCEGNRVGLYSTF